MEFIFEIIVQFLGELILQFMFEALAELGLRSFGDTLKRPRNPILSTIGFLIWGTIAGTISLLIMPQSPISDLTLRRINLLATPMAVGTLMMFIGGRREKKGQTLVMLDRFGYAFAFAFSMAIVRYIWAE